MGGMRLPDQVEASGRWEVINGQAFWAWSRSVADILLALCLDSNGQVVLLGQEPAGPSVSHLQLPARKQQLVTCSCLRLHQQACMQSWFPAEICKG